MNFRGIRQVVLIIFALCGTLGSDQPAWSAPVYNVLFIGNSHTYANDMPGMFRNIIFNTDKTFPRMMSSTVGGYTLADHLNNTNTLAMINNGYGGYHLPWDYVVIQEHSAYPTYAEVSEYDRDQFQSSACKLYDLVKAKSPNAKVLLFETQAWHQSYFDTYDDNYYMGSSADDMQARVRKWCNDTAYSYVPAHSTAASKNDMSVVRIGDAWERNYDDPNAIMLHVTAPGDYWHPNPSGTYLGALMMYSTMYHRSPQEALYYGGLNTTTAKYLQRIAAETMLTPEPAAFMPLLCGMGCMLLSRRRRSGRKQG